VAKSAHFELYTTAGEGRARAVLRHFETVQGFFGKLLGGVEHSRKVRIVVFSNDKEFALFRPNEVAAAFYWAGPDTDWIVMGSGNEESYPVAVHEYVHLLNHMDRADLPLWLDEGLAEVYSTLRPQGNKVLVGDLHAGRMRTIRMSKWAPLEQILTADHDSPLYNKKEHAGMLYSEAWLLTHMMMMEADWQPKFPEFVRAVANGVGSMEAIQKVFGRSPRTLDQELQGYMRSDAFRAALFDYKLEKSREAVETAPAPEYDWRLVVAELLRDEEAAMRQLDELRTQYPERPEAPAALGYRLWRKGKGEEARKHFAEAVGRGSRNPKLLWDFARMGAGESADSSITALNRLLELEPDDVDARILLARLHLRANRTAEASEALKPVKKVKSAQAVELFETYAYIAIREGNKEQAREVLQKVIDLQVKDDLKQNARKLLQNLDRTGQTVSSTRACAPGQVQRPTLQRREEPCSLPPQSAQPLAQPDPGEMARVEGRFRQVVCAGGKAWVVVEAGGKKLTFLVDAPTMVQVKGRGIGTLDLSCGPQRGETVVVGYVEKDKEKHDVDGFVRLMEWVALKTN